MSFISDRLGHRNLLELISSYRMLGCALLPMVLWWVVLSAGFGLATDLVLSSRAFKLFYLFVFFGVGARLLLLLKHHRYGLFLPFLGIFVILFSGMYWYGLSFTGTVELGAQETFTGFQKLEGRRWGFPPKLPMALLSAPAQNYGKAVVALAGTKKELPSNGRIFWRGYSIKLVGEGMAPFLIIDEAIGDENNTGFVRLPLAGDKPPYFNFGILPHRFYLSLPDKGEVVRNGVTPPVLKLGIRRGKLNVLTREVKLGELVRFEGHSVRFENGAPWVRLEIRDERALYIFVSGAALLIIGGVFIVFRRIMQPEAQL
jgi:hypothetical protein